MVQLFAHVEEERAQPGGYFPCPRCASVRPYELVWTRRRASLMGVPLMRVGDETEWMRCCSCLAVSEPLEDGEPNQRQRLDWARRIEQLVATVGVSVGSETRARAKAFLIRRGWFNAEADAVVGWASEVEPAASAPIVAELAEALATARAFTPRAEREVVILALASIFAVGGGLDEGAADVVRTCGRAAGFDGVHLDRLVAVAGGLSGAGPSDAPCPAAGGEAPTWARLPEHAGVA
jgi:hypothetical protein